MSSAPLLRSVGPNDHPLPRPLACCLSDRRKSGSLASNNWEDATAIPYGHDGDVDPAYARARELPSRENAYERGLPSHLVFDRARDHDGHRYGYVDARAPFHNARVNACV